MSDPTPEPTDAALLAAASSDPAAFRALYDRHAPAVHALALRRVGDRDAALDVTAETFARAWFARRRFRDRRAGTARPWLLGIARNVARESARRHARAMEATERLGLVLGIDRPPAGPEATAGDGWDEDLERALAALPPPQRRAVELRVLDDRAYGAVAAELGCSPGAARIRVSRGLDGLRRRLQEERP